MVKYKKIIYASWEKYTPKTPYEHYKNYYCTNCGNFEDYILYYNWCPVCGAFMKKSTKNKKIKE